MIWPRYAAELDQNELRRMKHKAHLEHLVIDKTRAYKRQQFRLPQSLEKMQILLLLLTILQLSRCPCPTGYSNTTYELVRDGECRGEQIHNTFQYSYEAMDGNVSECNRNELNYSCTTGCVWYMRGIARE
ncbi:hypothetical protein PMAYCL1PPCAC_22329, partial [Pristionchus mayeri]